VNQNDIVAEIRRRMESFDHDLVSRACLYWAKHTVDVLNEQKHRAVIQAGSMSWRMVSESIDDGVMATHFTYEFNTDEALRHIQAGRFPEIHCWAALPDSTTIIDVTTRYLIRNAAESGYPWRHTIPPDYLWCQPETIPAEAVYRPDVKAIAYALHCLKRIETDGCDNSERSYCSRSNSM
jgi:hypothetical protein